MLDKKCLKLEPAPVKKYSSGMRLRLAFSVAAYLQPEILLIDEFNSSFSPSSEKDISHPKIEDIIQTLTMKIESNEKLGIENNEDPLDQAPLAEKLIKNIEDIEFLEKYESNLETKILNHKNDSIVTQNIHRPFVPKNSKSNNSFGIFPNTFQNNNESLLISHMKKGKKENITNINGSENNKSNYSRGKIMFSKISFPSLKKGRLHIKPENLATYDMMEDISLNDENQSYSNIQTMG